MVTFDIISDTHIDFWVEVRNNETKQRQALDRLIDGWGGGADGVIVAGDIGHYNAQNLLFLELLAQRYETVLVTWGNHDLYLVSNKQRRLYADSFDRLRHFLEQASTMKGVYVLNGEEVIEVNGCRIWGSGLWYEMHQTDEHWRCTMNDARLIDGGKTYHLDMDEYGKLVRYRFDPVVMFAQEYSKLERLGEEERIDLLITHVPPFYPDEICQSDRYYGFDGRLAINRIHPQVWVCGHCHRPIDCQIGATRVVSNPLGYPDETRSPFSFQHIEIAI